MFQAVFTCFSPYLGIGRRGVGGGGGHNLLMQFFTPENSKIEVSEACFCRVITYNDHPSDVKSGLGCMHAFLIPLAIGFRGGGGQTGLVHNLLKQPFNLYSSKI